LNRESSIAVNQDGRTTDSMLLEANAQLFIVVTHAGIVTCVSSFNLNALYQIFVTVEGIMISVNHLLISAVSQISVTTFQFIVQGMLIDAQQVASSNQVIFHQTIVKQLSSVKALDRDAKKLNSEACSCVVFQRNMSAHQFNQATLTIESTQIDGTFSIIQAVNAQLATTLVIE